MCRLSAFSRILRIFTRGRVTFRPAFFSSTFSFVILPGNPIPVSLAISYHSTSRQDSLKISMMQKLRSLVILLIIHTLTACTFPGVYKIDVQQGNIVEKEAVDQLKVGMNRRQVQYLLGSPVLESTLDPSYDTYFYSIQLSGGKIYRQNITLEYENDILVNIAKAKLLPADLANPGKAYKLRGQAEPSETVEETDVYKTTN
ncbi:outer membrane protein assembly factor BamE [Hahella sp. KA22]|nr:outer membrane protein assembly factor BamE [Hahella sp. KA22]QAY57591.1 outer membrane protein assembly factor BamE [Hahella sp. KA22]